MHDSFTCHDAASVVGSSMLMT